MKTTHSLSVGKILNHAKGLGLTDETDLEQRASEVARIEGRRTVSGEHRRQAEREFNGEDLPRVGEDDAESTSSLSRDPSDPASNLGRQVPNRESEDEQFAAERLVAEGVDEAERDLMLAARRKKRG